MKMLEAALDSAALDSAPSAASLSEAEHGIHSILTSPFPSRVYCHNLFSYALI